MQAKDFYGTTRNVSKQEREASKTFHIRNFNNWVKALLISENSPSKGGKAIDFCCGKLGDLHKWQRLRLSKLVAIDIVEKSLQDAQERIKKEKKRVPPIEFICADCCKEEIKYSDEFDIVSCQFALHYAFKDEESLRRFIKNASSNLKTGGRFIGTIPYSNEIVKRFKENKLENSFYKIEFIQNEDRRGVFGSEYNFTLLDAVGGVSEYLVHFPTLVEIAKENNLVLISSQPFHNFFNDRKYIKDKINLFFSMNVLHTDGTLSDEEWDVIGLYRTFVFEKK